MTGAIVRSLIALVACLALFVAATVDAQVTPPTYGWDDRPAVPPQLADLAPDVPDVDHYLETWDYALWLDSGDLVQVRFLITNIGFGIHRQAAFRARVMSPGATAVEEDIGGVWRGRTGYEWDDGEWSAAQDGFSIQYDDNEGRAGYMRGDGELFELVINENRIKLDVTLEAELPLWHPGDGRVAYGWARASGYELSLLPRLRVRGRMSVRDHRSLPENWRDVEGVGVLEHTRTDMYPFEVADRWTKIRILRPDGLSILYGEMVLPAEWERKAYAWLVVGLDGEIIFESTEVEARWTGVVSDDVAASSYPIPELIELRARQGEDWLYLRSQSTTLVCRDNPLSSLSPVLRAILARTTSPMDYEIQTTYDAWIGLGGETASVHGTGWLTMNFSR